MFSTIGLFQDLPCPEKGSCTRINCLYSHRSDITQIPVIPVPVASTSSTPADPAPKASTYQPLGGPSSLVPVKRPLSSPLRVAGPSKGLACPEPPRKFQRVGPTSRPTALPSGPQTTPVSIIRVAYQLGSSESMVWRMVSRFYASVRPCHRSPYPFVRYVLP